MATLETAPSDVYRRVIETNLFGYVHGARVAMKQFKQQHHGVLINIDSVSAGAPSRTPAPTWPANTPSAACRPACAWSFRSRKSATSTSATSCPPPSTPRSFQHAANYTGRAVKALDPV